MEKRSTKIAYFVALGIFIVLLVILGLQFKGKENPVFVGGGAFYTTGDGRVPGWHPEDRGRQRGL